MTLSVFTKSNTTRLISIVSKPIKILVVVVVINVVVFIRKHLIIWHEGAGIALKDLFDTQLLVILKYESCIEIICEIRNQDTWDSSGGGWLYHGHGWGADGEDRMQGAGGEAHGGGQWEGHTEGGGWQ